MAIDYEKFDPLSQDIWFTPLMAAEWHLWKAGSPKSVCGLPWSMASMAWDATTKTPEKPCGECSGHLNGEKHER